MRGREGGRGKGNKCRRNRGKELKKGRKEKWHEVVMEGVNGVGKESSFTIQI